MSQMFATRNDLEPGIRRAEARRKLKYVPTGFYPAPEYPVYYSALDIPNLGTTRSRIIQGNEYLVYPAEAEVFTRAITQTDGSIFLQIFADAFPKAFLFRPGGWHTNPPDNRKHLMGGQAFPLSDDAEIRSICFSFWRSLTYGFRTLYDDYERSPWRVGPEAMEALKQGARLITYEMDLPETHDLPLPEETD
jgi:hypothetical protein